VRIIAATFSDEEVADRVLDELRDRYELGAKDAELAPLGTAGFEWEPGTLLAGRFHDDRTPAVRALVERNGGQVVMEVDEAATKRRLTPPPSRQNEANAEQRTRRRAWIRRPEPHGIFF
jgi:hypothetical protein